MNIEIIRCKGGWYWRMVSRNGKTLCHSEVYKSKNGAYIGSNSAVESIADGKYKWVEK